MVETVNLDLHSLVERTKRRQETVVQEFLWDLSSELMDNTPVITGFLRGSWYPSINTPGTAPAGIKDPGGQATLGRMALVFGTVRPGDVIYILNGANYAVHVEFGTSRMTPRAMVARTVANVQNIMDRTVARISRST